MDGILHIYDEGRTKVSVGDLFGIVAEAEARLTEKENSVAISEDLNEFQYVIEDEKWKIVLR